MKEHLSMVKERISQSSRLDLYKSRNEKMSKLIA